MIYLQTLEYLYSRLPMFQRIGQAAYKANLDSTHALMDVLQHPYKKFKSIHVGGTNGKGSTSHLLASIFQSCGYKVGLYTSPHLVDFRERVRINGEKISQEYIIEFVENHKQQFEAIEPSFFEWTVALAFQYFVDELVDIAIIEVGMGGRLDSTNVITPEVSVITNIGFDHQQFLGNTLPLIAGEKAGIIKPNVPVVVGEFHPETFPVFESKAKTEKAPIYLANPNQSFETDLKGNYQRKNTATVAKVLEVLQERGVWVLPENLIQHGAQNVVQQTNLLGRWQITHKAPLTVCDTGHNEHGVRELITQIEQQNATNTHIVWGMVNDKNPEQILQLLPKSAHYYLTQASIPRALPVSELAHYFEALNLNFSVHSTVESAYLEAKKQAISSDFIFIGGSTFVVADYLTFLQANEQNQP